MASFLKGLPSYNESNFTRVHVESGNKSSASSSKKTAVYISTKDHPSQQVITTEKTNILLRYLHQQWDKRSQVGSVKRDSHIANLDGDNAPPSAKIARLDVQ